MGRFEKAGSVDFPIKHCYTNAVLLYMIRYDTVYLRALKSWWDCQSDIAHSTETSASVSHQSAFTVLLDTGFAWAQWHQCWSDLPEWNDFEIDMTVMNLTEAMISAGATGRALDLRSTGRGFSSYIWAKAA